LNHSSLLPFLAATERPCLCFGVIRYIFEVDRRMRTIRNIKRLSWKKPTACCGACSQAQQGAGKPQGTQMFKAEDLGRVAARDRTGASPRRRAAWFSRLCVGPTDLLYPFVWKNNSSLQLVKSNDGVTCSLRVFL